MSPSMKARARHGIVLSAFLGIAAAGFALTLPGRADPPGAGGAVSASGTPLPDGHSVGAAKPIGNLTVFAITARTQKDVGPVTTLDDALAKGTAEVRELGADASDNGGAQVNKLAIANKGGVPIFVLAGTIVKGGKQDREIGQDFVVGANQTVPVDAFCVEHGRWNAQRDGAPTMGKFGTMSQLANAQVRAAGQYAQNQGEVWANVEKVNEANKHSKASGTLMATLDAPDVAAKRVALARQAAAALDGVQPNADVVGMAYAIDGQVRGVRWFVNHKVFALYETTLVNTAAVDAITALAAASASGAPPVAPRAAAPADVERFVAQVEAAAVKETRAAASGSNAYKETPKAYGSKAVAKPAPTAAPVEFSADYLAK